MNTHTRSRFLAWLLLVAMVLTMLPTAAFAAEAATYTKITTMEELTSGQYVMVVNTGYGPGVYENGWITAQAIDAGSDTVTGSVLPWTITVDGDTVKLTDSNGVAAAPKGGNNNGIGCWRLQLAGYLHRWDLPVRRAGSGYRPPGQQ